MHHKNLKKYKEILICQMYDIQAEYGNLLLTKTNSALVECWLKKTPPHNLWTDELQRILTNCFVDCDKVGYTKNTSALIYASFIGITPLY